MLQEAQRTSAPSATSVSMSTAVCTVMCSDPVTRAPASGWVGPYSVRMAMRPGISCSASSISLRPKSASARSATLKSPDVKADMNSPDAPVDEVSGYRYGVLRVCDRFVGSSATLCFPTRADHADVRNRGDDREHQRYTCRSRQRRGLDIEQLQRRCKQHDGEGTAYEPARSPRRDTCTDVHGRDCSDQERRRQ